MAYHYKTQAHYKRQPHRYYRFGYCRLHFLLTVQQTQLKTEEESLPNKYGRQGNEFEGPTDRI